MKKTVPPKNISKCLKKIFNWLSHSLICMNKPTDPVLVSILLTLNNIPPLFQFIYCWLLTCFWFLGICLFKVNYKDRRIKPIIAALVFLLSNLRRYFLIRLLKHYLQIHQNWKSRRSSLWFHFIFYMAFFTLIMGKLDGDYSRHGFHWD